MNLESLSASIDIVWILIGCALVYFMQAGFAIVEAGLTRAKNTGNILMKNLMDFCLGTVAYLILGYGLMKGADVAGLIGKPSLSWLTGNLDYTELIFNTVFCATAATIVSGAMAERTKFLSYCIYSFVISLVVYPVSGHWIWGGGWLAQLGFHDFAGSTAVHMVGGISAFIGAAILGPRIGKYDKNGKPRAIPGHNMTFAALGVFLLWFCWFGFNGASSYGVGTVDASGQYVSWGKWLSQIFVTTNLAPCVAADVCLIVTWIRYKKPDVSMCLNGCLAGLVAITAGCDAVTPVGAALIGAISGLIVIFGVEFLDKVIKVDDPVGAVAVHGMNGAFGTIAVGLFATKNGIWGAIAGNTTWGAAFKFLGVQFLGVISVAAWTTLCMVVLFTILKKTIGLRVSAQVELEGLDIHEHGLVSAYSGFAMEPDTILMEETIIPEIKETESPVYKEPSSAPVTVRERKMTQVTMLIRYEKLDALKQAMNSIGVAGMTITEVVGCGMQKIKEERALYRGDPVDVKLKPRLKVEIVISAIPVKTVIDKAKEVLYTGKFGDGKIFVTDVEDVIKVRTGENGYDALQD